MRATGMEDENWSAIKERARFEEDGVWDFFTVVVQYPKTAGFWTLFTSSWVSVAGTSKRSVDGHPASNPISPNGSLARKMKFVSLIQFTHVLETQSPSPQKDLKFWLQGLNPAKEDWIMLSSHFSASCRRERRWCNWILVGETLFAIFHVMPIHQLHR